MTIKEKIDTWLDEAKQDLIRNYNQMGLRASGQWERELEPRTKIEQDRYHAIMLGMDYTYYLEKGRGPTKGGGGRKGPSLYFMIRKWIDDKGIVADGISRNSLAYLITRKIHTQGIKVPNQFNKGGLVNNVITRQRINELAKDLSLIYIEDIKSSILKDLQ